MLLYLIFCAACLSAFSYSSRVDRYFRTRYPAIWNTFGFAGNSPHTEDTAQVLDLAAQRRYKAFLRSQARRNLQDAKLDHMILTRYMLNFLAAALFVATLTKLVLQFAPL